MFGICIAQFCSIIVVNTTIFVFQPFTLEFVSVGYINIIPTLLQCVAMIKFNTFILATLLFQFSTVFH